MKNIVKAFLGVAVAALMFTSCAKAPEVEINNAKAAVEAVKTIEAARYVPAEFNALQDSLNAALLEVENQNAKICPLQKL